MQKGSHVRVATASLIGTSIEWYDFFIYGTCAALIFPKLFFSNLSPTMAAVVSFMTYAVGFFARPMGALLFGHYGDKIGRKKMLTLSLLLMGGATVAIGLLPTYETAGIFGAVMLLILRILQGFAVGGEWGSAVVMAVEHSPPNRKGLFGSFVQMGVPIGLLLSTAVFTTVSTVLTDAQLMDWGWRIPFLASALMILVGTYIRNRLEESPEFILAKREQQSTVIERAPIAEVFSTHWRLVLLIGGMRTMQNTMFNVLTVFLLSYIAKTLGMPKSVGLNALLIASAVGALCVPFWGHMTDVFGRKKVALLGSFCATLWVLPLFNLVGTQDVFLITLAMVIASFIHDIAYASQAVYIAELFPTRVRLTGANVSYSLGSVFAGCLIPFLPLLLDRFGTEGVVAVLIGVGITSILCTEVLYETLNKKPRY